MINQVESWEMEQVRAGRMSPYRTGFGSSVLVFRFRFLGVFLSYKHFEAEYFFTPMKTDFPMITKPVRLLPNPTSSKKKRQGIDNFLQKCLFSQTDHFPPQAPA